MQTTRPCEFCGQPVTKSATQQSQRKYWACDRSCANKLRIKLGNTPGWSDNPYRGQQEMRPCAQCGTPVTRYLNPQNQAKDWYCSYACRGRWQQQWRVENGTFVRGTKPRTGDTVPCKLCGTPFYRQPAYARQGRFLCSRECNKAWQRRNQVMKTCRFCGKDFPVRPSEQHLQSCSRDCQYNAQIKRPTGRTHNGKPVIENAQGYFMVYEPTHPAANRAGRVLEHRWVMEQHLGRVLTTQESINHINHDKHDNRLENLEILTPSDHSRETNGYTRRARAAAFARLAEYERRFGPLT